MDNASADGSMDYVRQHFPWVQVISSETNTGFAEGNNLGLARARGEYIGLVNSDSVLEGRWLPWMTRQGLREVLAVRAVISEAE